MLPPLPPPVTTCHLTGHHPVTTLSPPVTTCHHLSPCTCVCVCVCVCVDCPGRVVGCWQVTGGDRWQAVKWCKKWKNYCNLRATASETDTTRRAISKHFICKNQEMHHLQCVEMNKKKQTNAEAKICNVRSVRYFVWLLNLWISAWVHWARCSSSTVIMKFCGFERVWWWCNCVPCATARSAHTTHCKPHNLIDPRDRLFV
jgi:hypothetical protein